MLNPEAVVYLRSRQNFILPTYFLFDKTEQTDVRVAKTDWTYGIRGFQLQLVTYEYKVNDSIYVDNFKAGQREGFQKTGDKLLIEYSINKPEKNKVVGYYRSKSKSINSTKLKRKTKHHTIV